MNCIATGALAALMMVAGTSSADETGWLLESSIDKATYQPVATMSQSSLASISDEYGAKEVHPRLEFYCEPNGDTTIRARIDWQRFISSFNTEVTFDTADGDSLTLKLGVDKSNKITSTRNADDVSALIGALHSSDSLTIHVTPYSEAPVSVDLQTSGFLKALEQLQANCNP
ncbi:MAG: hypothetical protein WBM68_01715 [Woeseia sp.]